MSTSTYTVTGMSCGSCASKVRAAVGNLPGVTEVEVKASSGQLTVTGDSLVTAEAVRAAVADAGYQVKG